MVQKGADSKEISQRHEQWMKMKTMLVPYTLFFNKNVVFPAQAEYFYFSADFRLKIFLYYS